MDFLVETCLLTHGLKSISDSKMFEALSNFDADYVWIEGGNLKIGKIDKFIDFRKKHCDGRANFTNIDFFQENNKDAAITASGTMKIAYEKGIPLVVSCGIGGISSFSGDHAEDVDAIIDFPVTLLATSPKDMLDLDATVRTLREGGVCIEGCETDILTGYVFNNVNEKLDKVFSLEEKLSGNSLILNQIPYKKRIKDSSILDFAVKKGISEAKNGKAFHPVVNAELDRLTEGWSSQIQFDSIVENIRLATMITERK